MFYCQFPLTSNGTIDINVGHTSRAQLFLKLLHRVEDKSDKIKWANDSPPPPPKKQQPQETTTTNQKTKKRGSQCKKLDVELDNFHITWERAKKGKRELETRKEERGREGLETETQRNRDRQSKIEARRKGRRREREREREREKERERERESE